MEILNCKILMGYASFLTNFLKTVNHFSKYCLISDQIYHVWKSPLSDTLIILPSILFLMIFCLIRILISSLHLIFDHQSLKERFSDLSFSANLSLFLFCFDSCLTSLLTIFQSC